MPIPWFYAHTITKRSLNHPIRLLKFSKGSDVENGLIETNLGMKKEKGIENLFRMFACDWGLKSFYRPLILFSLYISYYSTNNLNDRPRLKEKFIFWLIFDFKTSFVTKYRHIILVFHWSALIFTMYLFSRGEGFSII